MGIDIIFHKTHFTCKKMLECREAIYYSVRAVTAPRNNKWLPYIWYGEGGDGPTE